MLHFLYSNVILWYYEYTHSSLNTWLQSFLVCCEIIFTVNIVPFLLLWTMFYMLSRLGVHPSCLYNQSRVNPATTNHRSCPCHVVTTPLTEDNIQLQWLERVAVGLGQTAGFTDGCPWWGDHRCKAPPPHVQECNKDLLLHPPAAQLGNFPDAKKASKANLLYKETGSWQTYIQKSYFILLLL